MHHNLVIPARSSMLLTLSISARRKLRKTKLSGHTLVANYTDNGSGSITLMWAATFASVTWLVGLDGTDKDGSDPWSTNVLGSQTSLTFTDLIIGQMYNLTVSADGLSATKTVIVGGGTPSNTISSFGVTATTTSSITLGSSYSGAPLSYYTLTRNGSTLATIAADQTAYQDDALSSGSTYTYTLPAVYPLAALLTR